MKKVMIVGISHQMPIRSGIYTFHQSTGDKRLKACQGWQEKAIVRAMKRTLVLFGLASLVLSACAGLHLSGPNDDTVVEDGIAYYLETDKSVYALGEGVRIR